MAIVFIDYSVLTTSRLMYIAVERILLTSLYIVLWIQLAIL